LFYYDLKLFCVPSLRYWRSLVSLAELATSCYLQLKAPFTILLTVNLEPRIV